MVSKRFVPKTKGTGTRIPIRFKGTYFDVPVHFPKGPYTRKDLRQYQGKWVQFRTGWGLFKGVVERVDKDAVLIKLPSEYDPELTSGLIPVSPDVQLAGGYGFDGHPGCYPYWKNGPWCWFWFPFFVIVIIIPWFWW